MDHKSLSRRQFMRRSALLTGAAVVATPLTANAGAAVRTATDLVPLGKRNYKISRLGLGTGSNGGRVQRDLGPAGFTRLVRYAYDRGVTYIDTADNYNTHGLVKEAIRELPREKLWIQTKMPWGEPKFVQGALQVIDRYRRELGTDYIDSLLIHCTTKPTWTTDLRSMMDAFDEAQQRGWIRMKGVSCHGLPALRCATQTDWIEVQLARVNPQGRHVDGKTGEWAEPGIVPDAMKEIKSMHAKGRGIIGMKIIGNGDFRDPVDREKSVKYAMTCGFVDSVVIGFGSTTEIDEAITRINRALA